MGELTVIAAAGGHRRVLTEKVMAASSYHTPRACATAPLRVC